MDHIKILDELRRVPTLSGYEDRGADQIRKLLAPYFDKAEKIGVNSLLFTKKCKKRNAPKILIDAHLDELGLIVSDIKDDGLITVTNLGGMDRRTYTASKYTLHADKGDLTAVSVKQPYLVTKSGKLPKPGDFWLFTGLTKEELIDKGVRVGTSASCERYTEKLGDKQFYGAYMDDKSCAVCALIALEELKDKELGCDVCLLFSSQEESCGAGFPTGAYAASPDEIIVVDVDLGFTPDTDESKTVKMGEGPSVSISVSTDRRMTKDLLRLAKEKEIPVQPAMNVRNTGTNASDAPFLAGGIPTACIGLPLKYMHTTIETLYEKDLTSTGKLIAAYIDYRFGAKGEKEQ